MTISFGVDCSVEEPFQGAQVVNCPLFVCMSGHIFPHKQWDEMAVTVLSLWIATILDNSREFSIEFELNFMEGGYQIVCQKNGEIVHLSCVERVLMLNKTLKRVEESCKVICDEVIEFISLLHELKKTSSQLIQFLEQNINTSDPVKDLETLKMSVVQLSQLISELEINEGGPVK
jgi:hypothetical protein